MVCHQQRCAVDALLPTTGTWRAISGRGSSSDNALGVRHDTHRMHSRAGGGGKRVSLNMRTTLTPSARLREPEVLERNDGGTQSVREISEQMAQV